MGRAKEKKRFLLTAEQIVNDLNNPDGDSFCVGALAYSEKFNANDDEATLDIIENVLKSRGEDDSKRFLHSVQIPSYPLKRRDISNSWLIHIPNEFYFIPDQIYSMKCSLRSVLDYLASPFEDIGDFLLEPDVIKCLELLKKIKDDSSFKCKGGVYWLDEFGPLNFDDTKLAQAADIHKKRLELLLASPEKAQYYLALQEALQEICWNKFRELEPKQIPIDKGWAYSPYTCVLSFDVDANNHKATNIDIMIDADIDIGANPNRIVISRGVFTSLEGSQLEAVRDMHQVIHLAMVEYYRKIFPDQTIGEVCLPMLLME